VTIVNTSDDHSPKVLITNLLHSITILQLHNCNRYCLAITTTFLLHLLILDYNTYTIFSQCCTITCLARKHIQGNQHTPIFYYTIVLYPIPILSCNTHAQDTLPNDAANVNLFDADHSDVTPSQPAAPEHDAMDIADDNIDEFSDDKESFNLMTLAVTLSQQIASQTQGSPMSFQKLMMNMLGDRLWKDSKNYQFRSPFESKDRRLLVPLTKTLALMKKIKQDPRLHRYMFVTLANSFYHTSVQQTRYSQS
jgi:hypothetical protein